MSDKLNKYLDNLLTEGFTSLQEDAQKPVTITMPKMDWYKTWTSLHDFRECDDARFNLNEDRRSDILRIMQLIKEKADT